MQTLQSSTRLCRQSALLSLHNNSGPCLCQAYRRNGLCVWAGRRKCLSPSTFQHDLSIDPLSPLSAHVHIHTPPQPPQHTNRYGAPTKKAVFRQDNHEQHQGSERAGGTRNTEKGTSDRTFEIPRGFARCSLNSSLRVPPLKYSYRARSNPTHRPTHSNPIVKPATR